MSAVAFRTAPPIGGLSRLILPFTVGSTDRPKPKIAREGSVRQFSVMSAARRRELFFIRPMTHGYIAHPTDRAYMYMYVYRTRSRPLSAIS